MRSKAVLAHLYKAGCLYSLLAVAVMAAPPVVKTVPAVASNPLLPHTTFATKNITLKGTCDQQGANFQWTWDFGDGSPVATGTVTDKYVIQAQHVYAGAVGTIYTARLTVQNTTTGETASRPYYIQMMEKALDTEVNVAIDEGLWFLHKTQTRSGSNGDWRSSSSYGNQAVMTYYSVTVANLNAFEVNGHLETGSSDNPYVETVARGMRSLFSWLASINIGLQNPDSRNPDTNANGIGLVVNQSYPYYQGGMFMDAIVASGTPNAVAATGPANVVGRTYKSILQDMVDAYAWAQYDGLTGSTKLGGWRYSANEFPDNSACQWAAIGMLAAERNWGCIVPNWVKEWNIPWLDYTQAANGTFGYTNTSGVWGVYATTPSGMVQMVFDGIGRGTSPAGGPSWELAETYMRNNFGNSGGATVAVKDYYYGLFSFVKSLLLHTQGGVPAPIVLLHSQTAGVPDIDWYAAEVSKGAPTDGVARTLVADQNAAGYWYGHNYSSDQYFFETAFAIMMLHQTLFESGVPVAVAKAIPNPAVAGQLITLDGSDSYHQDPSKHIVKWEWDLNSSGVFTVGLPQVTTSFGSVGTYPVRLRVTDDASTPKTAETTVNVLVTTPPVAPTADAGGPYHYCDVILKWFLDGRNSNNPDEGLHQPGPYPGDTIQEYAWDLDGDNDFNDAFGATPDVRAFFTGAPVGAYLIKLRVTDTTAASYPGSGSPNLASTATSVLYIDSTCLCVALSATPVPKGVQLNYWAYAGAASYNIYRSNVSGGPYTWIANTTALTYADIVPGPLDQTYYYVVRPAAINGDELCQSAEAAAEPLHAGPVATCVPAPITNTGKYYYTIDASSETFGHMQLGMYVGDSAAGGMADLGPLPPGCIVYIRTNFPTAAVRPGAGSIERYIFTKGSARVWAEDPLGQKSAVLTVP